MTKLIISYKKGFLFILIIFGASIASCKEKIIKTELVKKNPVGYVFSTNKGKLHELISSQLKVTNMMLWNSTQKIMVANNISNLFSKPENMFDFYLEGVYYLHKSKIYLKANGDSLNYLAGFFLHIEEIDSTHTKVSIITIDPKVVLRRELLPSLPHMLRMDKTISVAPSTIEEYEILLEIGRLVGEINMPSINLPETKLRL